MDQYPQETTAMSDQAEIVIEEESLKEDYTKIPNTLLKRSDISPGAKLAYVMLLSYAHKVDRCFPGQRRLAADMGVAVRSVIRYMQELVKVSLLRVKRRGLGLTNVYYLTRWSKPRVPAEASPGDADQHEAGIHSEDDRLSLPQMPDRHREKNKSEQDKISNAVSKTSLEERGVRSEWAPVGQLVAKMRTASTAQLDHERWLAEQILAQTGDQHSLGCYRLVARACPQGLIFDALSELKQARHSGQVKRSRGALFLSIVRRLCSEQGLPDPLGKRGAPAEVDKGDCRQAAGP